MASTWAHACSSFCLRVKSLTSRPHGTAARTSIPSRWPQWSGRSSRPIPTITVINVADVLERIENIVDQITFVVRLLAGFSILAGLTILASSIASTRFRRMQEAVVLKTLGATRMRIVSTFSVEFCCSGAAGRRGGRRLRQRAYARAVAPARRGLSNRMGRDARIARSNVGAGHRYWLDRKL